MIFIALLLVVTSLVAFYMKQRYRYQEFSKQGIVGPKPVFPFGNTKRSFFRQRNIIYDVDDIYRNYKNMAPFCGFFAKSTPYILPIDPELIKQILIRDFTNFKNTGFEIDPSKDPIVSRHTFWRKDDAWKEKRNDLTPSMTPTKLKPMFPLILEGTKRLVKYIKSESIKCSALDARSVFSRYTCDTVIDCLLGFDAQSFRSENPYYCDKGNKFVKEIANSVIRLFPGKICSDEVNNFLIDSTRDAMNFRKENKTDRNDFLSHIISLKDKKPLSDIDAASAIATIFLDGYETTAIALHYIFYELAKNERVQKKLRAEIAENVDGTAPISYDLLLELPFLDQVFYESLRLHPPLAFTTRVASDNIDVNGGKNCDPLTIKKGSAIWVPIGSIQRDPEYFPNPESFYPERFDDENGGIKSFRDRGVLIPFGDGPRMCLGMRYGYMQVKAAIVEVIRNFEVSLEKPLEELKAGVLAFKGAPDCKVMLKFKEL